MSTKLVADATGVQDSISCRLHIEQYKKKKRRRVKFFMAIHFKELKNYKNNRNIRAVVMNGSQHVNVYEPSMDDVQFILDSQKEWVSLEDGVTITDEDFIREFLPRFTDIEGIEDMTDEEISDVIENPTVALLSINAEIESIVTEIYRHITVLARRQLQSADFEAETMLAHKESFDRTIAMASKYSREQETPQKIQDAVERLTKAYSTGAEDALFNKDDLENIEITEEDRSNLIDLIERVNKKEEELKATNDKKEPVEVKVEKQVDKDGQKDENNHEAGIAIDMNSVKKNEESGDVFTSDGKNLSKMMEERRKRFSDPKKKADVSFD